MGRGVVFLNQQEYIVQDQHIPPPRYNYPLNSTNKGGTRTIIDQPIHTAQLQISYARMKRTLTNAGNIYNTLAPQCSPRGQFSPWSANPALNPSLIKTTTHLPAPRSAPSTPSHRTCPPAPGETRSRQPGTPAAPQSTPGPGWHRAVAYNGNAQHPHRRCRPRWRV